MGRCAGKDGKVLTKERVGELVLAARTENPKIRVKFNATVNRHNFNDSLIGQLLEFAPDRIKVFKQLPFDGNAGITDEEFDSFLKKNELKKNGMFWGNTAVVIEDNDAMTQSYLMIDPEGRFFQNGGEGGKYIYSEPVYRAGIRSALGQIPFEIKKYNGRYGGDGRRA
jgi:radical S-adenosyl methionine domain-containing protein 2